MKTKFLLAAFIASVLSPIFAQTPDKAKLDSYFNALEANNKYMGSVALSKNGKTVYSKSIGYADVAINKKVTEESKFRIGSISKIFTATLVMKAVEAKKLKLTDNLSAYFPTIPNASKITITQLLQHRTGIHNFTNDAEYLGWMGQPKSQADMLAVMVKGGSDFEPGAKFEYSNSNYVLLSFILEKIYKQPYKEIVDAQIVKPLGLKNTFYGGKINPAKNEVNSYKFSGKWEKEPETDMSIPTGAGAMVSTATNLSRFIEALFDGKIISPAGVEQMKTMTDGYGLGLHGGPFDGKNSYGHNGGIDGFVTKLSYFPEDKVTIAMVSNGVNINTNDVAVAALSWMYLKPFEVPEFKTFNYKSEDLDKYLGAYSTTEIPIGLTITKNGATLMAQGTGQAAFPLDAVAKDTFKFEQAGIELLFKPESGQMILKQGGGTFTFTKAK